jgi:adenylate cyclase
MTISEAKRSYYQNQYIERINKQLREANKDLENKIKERTAELEKEQQNSEKLLLNILPKKILDQLKVHGVCMPEVYENVTVFFSDIVNFTNISRNFEPKVIIDELNELFTAFDDIMESNNCERIKTIGDAYLAVSGLSSEDENHAQNIIKSAIDIRNYLLEKNKFADLPWEIRMGVHSGKIVGGIVGERKYIFDIFGEDVNCAARMEHASDKMEINVSEATYELTKNDFNFGEARKADIKGMGEMKMYFVK